MAYVLGDVHETRDFGYDEELAQWLAESGRRRVGHRKTAEGTDIETSTVAANDAARLSVRRLALAAVFALSAAQYLYADVELKIYQLPTLVVFASPATQ